jgi:biopolymer transport protein ExbB/TolQ
MTLRECAGSIVSVVAVVSLAFGAYFYFEKKFALAEELMKTNQQVEQVNKRLDQKIDQDRSNALQEKLWKWEDRLQQQRRAPTQNETEEIRQIKAEKEKLDRSLNGRK